MCRIQPFESVEDEEETKDVDSTATETSKEGVPKLGETKKRNTINQEKRMLAKEE